MDPCCEEVSFTIGDSVLLLNGSVEVVGGYVYHTEGSSCDIMPVRANVSIREGMPVGAGENTYHASTIVVIYVMCVSYRVLVP